MWEIPRLNSSITVCSDPWQQTVQWTRLTPFGKLKVANQHCLRTEGVAGFNYGSLLNWEKDNFHSHASSLVMFSHCLSHSRRPSHWFPDFYSPQSFPSSLLCASSFCPSPPVASNAILSKHHLPFQLFVASCSFHSLLVIPSYLLLPVAFRFQYPVDFTFLLF